MAIADDKPAEKPVATPTAAVSKPATPAPTPAVAAIVAKQAEVPKPAPAPAVAAAKPVDAPKPAATVARPTPPVAAKPAPASPKIPAAKKPAPSAPVAKIAAPKPKTFPPAAVPANPKTKEIQMATTIKDATDKAQDQAKTMIADMNGRAKSAMQKSGAMLEDMNGFAKGNVEAVVESSKIYAKGLESMGQDAAAYAKKSYEDMTAAFKAMSTVKSPTDFFKLHSDYTRAAFDAMVAETSKSTEKMVKLVSEAAQPISSRVAVAVEKVKIAA